METLVPSAAALTISTIYCVWNSWHVRRCRHARALRERVAYMLWKAADQGT
jgi:hypothetical protein